MFSYPVQLPCTGRLFLASEAKMPTIESPEKMMKPILMAEISPGKVSGFIGFLPMKSEISIIAIPILSICPIILIVPTTPDATPR